MANKRFFKAQTPNSGNVLLSCSFASGADTNGEFVEGSETIDADGYIVDAYGSGDLGLGRIAVGTYTLTLDKKYKALIAGLVQVQTTSAKAAFGQLVFPTLGSVTMADGSTRSTVSIRIVNGSGAAADLAHNDRINIFLSLDNSLASP